MKKTTRYTGIRRGIGIWYVLGFIAVIALLATLMVPRLGNTDLPALESNLKEDTKNLKDAMAQAQLTTVNKDTNGTSLRYLQDSKILKAPFTDAMSTATYSIGQYTAMYNNNIKIMAKGNKDSTPAYDTYLLHVDFSGMTTEQKNILGPNYYGFLKKLAGDNQVKCRSAAASPIVFGDLATTPTGTSACDATKAAYGEFVIEF